MSARRQGRPTSVDVARASGVSQATVSYVLNQTPGQTISDATRDRVLAAAKELGYVPSFAGRTLREGGSRIVLLDYNDVPRGSGVMRFSDAFSAALQHHQLSVIALSSSESASLSLEQMAQTVSPIAVVSFAVPSPERVTFLRRVGVQYISHADFEAFDASLLAALTSAAEAQIDYLVTRGHRIVAYVTPFEPELTDLGAGRLDAAARRAAFHGIELVHIDGSAGLDALDEQIRASVDGKGAVTALACYNDELAFPVLASLARLGINVPGDVAVIGVDDIPLARHSIPALTTVHFESSVHGANTAHRLLAAMGLEGSAVQLENVAMRIAERDSA